jgi:hypothetical protein
MSLVPCKEHATGIGSFCSKRELWEIELRCPTNLKRGIRAAIEDPKEMLIPAGINQVPSAVMLVDRPLR